jgi:acetyl esterase/lipase
MPESNWVALELASRGVPVLAVDYAKCLSGIHFPVPADDVLAAWRFAAARAVELLGVPASALALGGASAGSTLAAGVVTTLVAAGEDVPGGLVLVYPVLHPNGPAASRDLDLDSPHAQLTLNYAGSPEALADPRAFPGLGDGAGFPRTLMLVCELDPLRPSGEAFAATLEAAGRPVDLVVEAGAAHGHIDNPGDAGALRSLREIAAWLPGVPA